MGQLLGAGAGATLAAEDLDHADHGAQEAHQRRHRGDRAQCVQVALQFMRHGAPSLAVEYRLCSGGPLIVTVEALCTWRDAHGERHERNGLRVDPQADGFVVVPPPQ